MANLKTNTTTIQNILNTINALPEAGGNLDTSSATAQPQHILAPYTAYAKGILMTGTLKTEELTVTPTSEVQTFTPNGKLYSKVVINAIDPSFVQPSYTESGGIYTLNPGESLSYYAKTYLMNALSVTAADAGGGRILESAENQFSYYSYSDQSLSRIEITLETTNLIGCYVYMTASFSPDASKDKLSSMFVDIINNQIVVTLLDSSSYVKTKVISAATISVFSSSIRIVFPSDSGILGNMSSWTGYIKPIYNA